jgi:hypothetical protein
MRSTISPIDEFVIITVVSIASALISSVLDKRKKEKKK